MRELDQRTDKKWINQTCEIIKVKMSKIKSQITIFEDKTCVDDWKINTTTLDKRKWICGQAWYLYGPDQK